MKKGTYDTVATTAVVALVLSTFLAQRVSGAGYVFGVLAILSAVASLSIYVKALPAGRSRSKVKNPVTQVPTPAENIRDVERVQEESEIVDTLVWKVRPAEKKSALGQMEKRWRGYLRAELFRDIGDERRIRFEKYFQVAAQTTLYRDPAAIIAGVVETLCGSSKEPRFEFILSPDGSFKIRQIPERRTASGHPLPLPQKPEDQGSETVN